MPAKSPSLTPKPKQLLQDLGQKLRDSRKQLGISAISTAEASGISRVTLYRIEKGEESVAMGAYISVIFALGLELELRSAMKSNHQQKSGSQKLPTTIRIASYKQLKRLAWQLKDTQEITPKEALDLYEKNWRHVDHKKMDKKEHQFLEKLLAAFGRLSRVKNITYSK